MVQDVLNHEAHEEKDEDHEAQKPANGTTNRYNIFGALRHENHDEK